jgi:mono/diheme cytochrome c family protein
LAVIRSRRFAFTALATAVLSATALAEAPAQVRPQGDAANGKQIYLRDACFTCHGRSGQGGVFRGPTPILAKTALPFDGFRELLRDPPGDMPAYSEAVLSDKDIADIYAFLESLPGPRSPKDIRVLDNLNG